MNILIINGPNMNFTGTREPALYGNESFEQILLEVNKIFPGINIEYFQSNHEGAIVDKLQKYIVFDGLVINAAALSHYSYLLHDTLRLVKIPKVEVHMTNIHAREPFRQTSVLSPACDGVIVGFGKWSYVLAIQWLVWTKH